MPDHSGHRARMRDKYVKSGPRSMTDAELAEIALYSVLPRCDVRPLAEELVNNHGGLSGVASLSAEELVEIKGVGGEVALFIQALKGLAVRAESQRRVGAVVRGIDSVKRYIAPKFQGTDREMVLELCIGRDSRVKSCVPVFTGPFPPDELNMKEFIFPAVTSSSETVIVAHNRINFTGSTQELEVGLIRELDSFLDSFDITLLDYLIFFNGQCISALNAHFLQNTSKRREYASSGFSPITAGIRAKRNKIRTLSDDED